MADKLPAAGSGSWKSGGVPKINKFHSGGHGGYRQATVACSELPQYGATQALYYSRVWAGSSAGEGQTGLVTRKDGPNVA